MELHQSSVSPPAPCPPTAADRPTVLVLDDESPVRRFVLRALHRTGFTLLEAATGAEALALAERYAIDLLLVDVRLEGECGLKVALTLRQRYPNLIVLVTSGADPEEICRDVQVPGAVLMSKPFMVHELVQTVGAALSDLKPGTHLCD